MTSEELDVEFRRGDERWCSIPGYEGLYVISNHCRVVSHERIVERRNGTRCTVQARVMHQSIHRRGMRSVRLSRDNVATTVYLHKLVAEVAGAQAGSVLGHVQQCDEDPGRQPRRSERPRGTA